jgi:acyl carrier protein
MTIQETIRQFVIVNFHVPRPADLDDQASLLAEGIVDSTGVLELIAFIEGTFGIKVLDEEILPDNFDGIARTAAFVAGKVADASEAVA